jgi:cytoplasmic iron level regulating protein YaaA (DUF328/UPF0246 family)
MKPSQQSQNIPAKKSQSTRESTDLDSVTLDSLKSELEEALSMLEDLEQDSRSSMIEAKKENQGNEDDSTLSLQQLREKSSKTKQALCKDNGAPPRPPLQKNSRTQRLHKAVQYGRVLSGDEGIK